MTNKIDKAALAARIREMEGLSTEDKSALLGLLNEQKRFGLVWEDKPEDAYTELQTKVPVLREVKDLAIINDDASNKYPNHILIEGDNLHALTSLMYAYEGKVDVIYIDPPYNTGNKDFIYNDSFVDAEDGYRHSKWLSFMTRRLKLAKRLLSNEGVIFISIGDDEQAPLKMLCDSLFGSANFIDVIARKAKAGSDQGTYFRPSKDYILVYAKNSLYLEPFSDKSIGNTEGKSYPFIEDMTGRKYRKAHSLFQASLDPLRGCKNQRYYIEAPDGTLVIPPGPHLPNSAEEGEKIVPQTREDKVWRWSCDSFLVNKGRIMFAKSKRSPLIDSYGNPTEWNVYEKKYEDEESDVVEYPLPDDFVDSFLNASATALLNSMGIDFSFSKPFELIKHLIDITNKKTDIAILDFFAGSGTTLHATMQLNAEDGGNRQCILVTNNENNICREVTYERNKRVINGYTTPKGEFVDGLRNNNLRYYQIDMLDREQNLENKKQLMISSTDLLCILNNIYTESDNLAGLNLPKNVARYFEEVDKKMLVIYEPNAIPFIVNAIGKMEIQVPMEVYVMSDGQYPYSDDFEAVASKVNLHAMPHSLYQAMRQVLPPKAKPADYENLPEVSDEELEEADSSIYKSDDND